MGCVIAAVDFAHEGGHNLVCVSGARTWEATCDSTLTLISLSSTMSTWASACLLDGRGVELLDPPDELIASFEYSDVPLPH